MATNDTDKHGTPAIKLETVATTQTEAQYSQKVQDGDEVLKILHEEFEPYTEEEEKCVLRKIDVRRVLLMLIVNGLQFVDKSVSTSKSQNLLHNKVFTIPDHHVSSHVWNNYTGPPRGPRIQLGDQYLLYWIPYCPVSNQYTHASLSNGEIPRH